MLAFALEYKEALKVMTSEEDYGLEKYRIGKGEWVIVAQLHEVLKVKFFSSEMKT